MVGADFVAFANIHKLRLAWSTIRHLRTSQITCRILRRFYRPSVEDGPPPPPRIIVRDAVEPASRTPCLTTKDTFVMLGQSGRIDSALAWNDVNRDKLWLYHCHYFEDLVASRRDERKHWHEALIAKWIEENPPGIGNGWEPYPLSLRISHWVLWSRLGGNLAEPWRKSLAVQVRWLRHHIEWHILANHVMANAKALVLAGCWAGGNEGDGWLAEGLELLQDQVNEQILNDGGHIERTPMYHCQVLNDLLDVVNGLQSTNLPIPLWLTSAIVRMGEWLAIMRHPDGDIPLFNDSTFGMAPTPNALAEYGRRLGIDWSMALPTASVWLPLSGYARMVAKDAVVFCDAAPLAPDWQPGHSHADTLTWEASFHEHRVVVDCGISTYGTSDERCRQRGTLAHNTVTIDDQDSSEVWSGFRVGRRARIIAAKMDDSGLRFCAVHDGYRQLGIRHERTWQLADQGLRIDDHVTGSQRHRLQTGILLHPNVKIISNNAGVYDVESRESNIRYRISVGPGAESCDANYHPSFGVALPTHRLTRRTNPVLPAIETAAVTW